jgi:curli biogenesis system outer membrane secretion channel CsgG
MRSPTRAVPALGAIALLATMVSSAAAQGRKVRVAVLDFANQTEWWKESLAKQAADQLVTELVQADAFDVIERSELEKIIAEQNFGNLDDSDLAIQIGKLMTVDYLITGSISRFSIKTTRILGQSVTEAESGVNVRVINTATAKIEGAFDGSGKKRGVAFTLKVGDTEVNPSMTYDQGAAQATLKPAIEDVAKQINGKKLEPTAGVETPTIAGSGADGSIYISQGENFGITVGQRFEVQRIVDKIVVNGEVVDVRTKKVGVIEVKEVLSRSSVCAVVEGEAKAEDRLVPIK